MRSKCLARLLFFLLILTTFIGCPTTRPVPAAVAPPLPPDAPLFFVVPTLPGRDPYRVDELVPLTTSILYRLGDNNNLPRDIDKFQLILSGKIIMENEIVRANDAILGGGRVRFEDIHTRNSVVIEDRTEGQALNVEITRGEVIISVAFEAEDKYRLDFAAVSNNSEEFFYLKYYPAKDVITTNQKGSIEYGGETYRLTYTGETPRLMIKLTQQDTPRLNTRTVPGRTVN
jgi:hypothetical protein